MNDDFEGLTATQNPHYAKYEPSAFAWLYIAVDIRDMGMAKVGLTTKISPVHRIAEGKTYNPFLTLFTTYELSKCTFGVSVKELNDIEKYVQYKFGSPLKHLYSGRDSEWFFIKPEHAESQIDWYLAKRGFKVDGEPLYTFYEGPHNRHGVDIYQMRKIKRIYRPFPDTFSVEADSAGMTFPQYEGYYKYLSEFHSSGAEDKIYL